MSIGIIGYGFVGKAVAQLSNLPLVNLNIYDPGIKEYSSLENKRNAYSSEFVFICVPTPTSDSGELDISIVEEAVATHEAVKDFNGVCVIKSTIPVGTVDNFIETYAHKNIVHWPEFLTEKTAMEDFFNADEVVIGGLKEPSERLKRLLYEYYGEIKYNLVEPEMAELVKLTRNSFYALKVAFFNQIYDLCEQTGLDYQGFREVFAHEGRNAWVNPMHTYVPGPRGPEYKDGKMINENNRFFGGKCLSKDPLGLCTLADSYKVDLSILKEAIKANNRNIEKYDITRKG